MPTPQGWEPVQEPTGWEQVDASAVAAPQSNADKLRSVLKSNMLNQSRQAGAIQNASAPPTGMLATINSAGQTQEDFSKAAVPAAASDIWNMAKGIPGMVAEGAAPIGSVKNAEQAFSLIEGFRNRRAGGEGISYSTGAAVNEAMGVNVQGQEQAAREGSPGGVVGHAAAVPIAMAATTGAGEALGAMRAKIRAPISTNEAMGGVNISAITGRPIEETAAAVGPLRQMAREMNLTPGDISGEAGRLKAGEVASRTIGKFDELRGAVMDKASPEIPVSTRGVSARLRSYADTLPSTPDPTARNQVLQMAAQWDRDMPLSEVNANIEKLNKQLSYDKTTGAVIDEAHVARANRETAQALRDTFYSAIEQRTGITGLRNIGRTEGAVIDFRDGLDKAGASASVSAARKTTGQPGMAQAMLRAGTMKRAASIPLERAKGVIFGNTTALDTLNQRLRGAFFGPGESPNINIANRPIQNRPSRLLPQSATGRIPLASSDLYGPSAPPPISPLTRAQRLNLLLPESAGGGRIELGRSTANFGPEVPPQQYAQPGYIPGGPMAPSGVPPRGGPTPFMTPDMVKTILENNEPALGGSRSTSTLKKILGGK